MEREGDPTQITAAQQGRFAAPAHVLELFAPGLIRPNAMEPGSSPRKRAWFVEQTLEAINLADAVVGEQYRLRVPSRLDWVEAVVDHLTGRAVQCGALTQKRAGRVLLALHEALTNAIVHGNLEISSELKERGDDSFARAVAERSADPRYGERHVDVRSVYDGQAVRWVLSDQGKGFDVPKALRRLDEEDGNTRPSGRGMVMIRAFVDDVSWEDGGRRAILSVRKGDAEEKRAHARHALQKTVRVAPIGADGSVDWGSAHDSLARNISQEGIALLQSRLQTSGRVLITIPVEGGSVSVPAEVRHWHSLGDNVVEVGCRFEALARLTGPEAPATDEIASLVDRLEQRQAIPHERRVAPRIAYTARITVEGPRGSALGFARDLSRSGVAFVTTEPVTLDVVRLSLPQENDRPPLQLPARIVRCVRIMDGFHDVAAQFLGA